MNTSRFSPYFVAIGLLCIGCKDLSRFDTKSGEAYCGGLVAEDFASEGFEPWTSQSKQLKVALTLDTDHLHDIPGKLQSNDASFGPCAPHALFEDASVRVVKKALGDRLSSVQLNDDHEAESIAFVDSTCSGSMVAIISLVQDVSVELRLLRPAPAEESDDPERQSRFGVFELTRQNRKRDCKF